MASSPAKGAADLLVAASVGTLAAATGWAIYIGRFVDKPDSMISLYDTPGQSPNPKWLLNEPHFQVLVRGNKDDYAGAYAKANDVRDVLLGMNAQTVNGDRWDGVLMMGDILFLHYDENSRPMFSGNYKIFLEPAASLLTQRSPL